MMDERLYDEDEPIVEDRELNRRLLSWPAPEIPASLDRRIIESYRSQFAGKLPQRRYARSIRIPIPLAAAAILTACVITYVTARYLLTASNQAQVVEVIKQLEVPVPIVEKKVEIRTIYLKPKPQRERESIFDDRVKKRFEMDNDSTGVRGGNTSGVRNNPEDFRPVSEIVIAVLPGSSRH
ncbi:MAG: hypothetical protein ACRERV_16625, partial [Methylococcales bacterium]